MTRRGSFSVNAANQRSTRSIHDEPVGVMCQLTSVLFTDEVTDTLDAERVFVATLAEPTK